MVRVHYNTSYAQGNEDYWWEAYEIGGKTRESPEEVKPNLSLNFFFFF